MTNPFIIKRFLPGSLLGRSLLIIVVPLVLLQVVSGFIFYESHWDKVTLRLARNLAGDVAALIDLMNQNPEASDRNWIFALAANHMHISATFREGDGLIGGSVKAEGIVEEMLVRAMREYVGRPFRIDTRSMSRHVAVHVQLGEGVLEIITTRKRLFSSTTSIFVMWMVGTSMILFGLATIFMRNQVKPIRRLALAADTFGKGRDAPNFKPEGADEVRRAAAAFIAMRERIQRQISQRTEMLAGVSHDLKTPLTRMKLQLELLGADGGVSELKGDVGEMEHMLEGYLAFARGEGEEQPVPTNLTALLDDVVTQARRNGATAIDYHSEGETNLVENATRHAGHVSVRAGLRKDAVEITVDDDGPGIPEDQRDEAFRPFIRLERSRKPGTGGVGLGLTIARDVARGHGGDIELGTSPSGGLRVRVHLPT